MKTTYFGYWYTSEGAWYCQGKDLGSNRKKAEQQAREQAKRYCPKEGNCTWEVQNAATGARGKGWVICDNGKYSYLR